MSVTPLTLDTNTSWLVASTAVGIASVSFGAPYIAVVALKPIRPISAVALCAGACLRVGLLWLGGRRGHNGLRS
jgi:hypothetical protein